MSSTPHSSSGAAVANESPLPHTAEGKWPNIGSKRRQDEASSKGVTPKANPKPLTSMSRCTNSWQPTSVPEGWRWLPAEPKFKTCGIGRPFSAYRANSRVSSMAALTLPTPQYSTGTPAASKTPADSSRRATTTSVPGSSFIGGRR